MSSNAPRRADRASAAKNPSQIAARIPAFPLSNNAESFSKALRWVSVKAVSRERVSALARLASSPPLRRELCAAAAGAPEGSTPLQLGEFRSSPIRDRAHHAALSGQRAAPVGAPFLSVRCLQRIHRKAVWRSPDRSGNPQAALCNLC